MIFSLKLPVMKASRAVSVNGTHTNVLSSILRHWKRPPILVVVCHATYRFSAVLSYWTCAVDNRPALIVLHFVMHRFNASADGTDNRHQQN